MLKRVLRVLLVTLALLAAVFYVVFGPMLFGNIPSEPNLDVAPGVVQVVDGYVNLFMIDGGPGQLALIDAGNDPQGKALMANLAQRNRKPEEVRAILLTHGHPDHIAAAHLFPEATVYAFPEDAPLAAGEKRAAGPLPKYLDAPKDKTTKVGGLLKDGQNVVVGTATITAFHIPGHTGGSAAYLFHNVMFFGDSANGRSDGTVSSAPWIVSDDVEQNVRSLFELRKRMMAEGRSVKALAFGHTGPKLGEGVMSMLPKPDSENIRP